MDDEAGIGEAMQARGAWFHRETDATVTMFQVLGERGSGTNVVRRAIQKNTGLFRTEGLGWKHGFPAMVAIPEAMVVVCVLRGAMAWARAMHRRPWHAEPAMQALDFPAFLRAEWRSVVDRPSHFELLSPETPAEGRPLQYDRHPLTGRRFANLMALRRTKFEAMRGMARRECNLVYVQLERFQADPARFLAAFRAAFGLPPQQGAFRPVTRRMGHNHQREIAETPATPARIAEADAAFIRSEIDLDCEALFGYRY